jgi:hypothetical protein
MADEIVTPDDVAHNAENATLLYQNTPLLAQLLKLSYEDYAKRANLDTKAFIVGIQELVTKIIEPVCRQNPHDSRHYLAYIELFNQCGQGDFSKYPAALELIVFAITRLVQYTIESFRALDYHGDYDRFLDLLESIFKNDAIIQHNQHRNVLLLMEQLRQKPWY